MARRAAAAIRVGANTWHWPSSIDGNKNVNVNQDDDDDDADAELVCKKSEKLT